MTFLAEDKENVRKEIWSDLSDPGHNNVLTSEVGISVASCPKFYIVKKMIIEILVKMRHIVLTYLVRANYILILAASQGTMALHETGSDGRLAWASGSRKAMTSFPLIVHTVNAFLPSIKRSMWILFPKLLMGLLIITLWSKFPFLCDNLDLLSQSRHPQTPKCSVSYSLEDSDANISPLTEFKKS